MHDQLSIDSINSTRFVIGYADEDQYKYATMIVGILTGTNIAMYGANYIHLNQSYGVSLAITFKLIELIYSMVMVQIAVIIYAVIAVNIMLFPYSQVVLLMG